MRELSSEEVDIFDFLETRVAGKVSFYIETLDSKPLGLWNEPIVSFSLAFIPDDHKVITHFPTFGFCIESPYEEKELLKKLGAVLDRLNKRDVIVGHSVSCELKCKKDLGWQYCQGYDLPKVLARSKNFGVNLDFIRNFRTYDIMDVAYGSFRHSDHGKLDSNGNPKKLLSVEELEDFFNIIRPKNAPKLGPKVRNYFAERKIKEILLYNSSDAIIEAIIHNIFEHKMNVCRAKDGLISFKDNCAHIPNPIEISKLRTWKLLEE